MAAAKKAAADQRATSRTATIEKRKERVDSAAEAKKHAAQRKAKTELDTPVRRSNPPPTPAPTPSVSATSTS